jgi:GNAT superfamily N-acetyltransferase
VGTLDSRPVAIVHVTLLTPQEGWLEGIRVNPDVRRQGIGRAMVARALEAAGTRGASLVRLFTTASNTASQLLVEGAGFAQVAAFVRYAAPAGVPDEAEVVPAGAVLRVVGAGDYDRLWGYLRVSNLVPLNGGLVVRGWVAQSLTPSLLRQRLAAGEVFVLEAWDTIQALAMVRDHPGGADDDLGPRLEVEYLDGMADWIGRMALALRGQAAGRELPLVRLALPDLLILHDAMDGAGYERRGSSPLWCYARRLG